MSNTEYFKGNVYIVFCYFSHTTVSGPVCTAQSCYSISLV